MSIEEQYDAWVRGLMGSTRAGSRRDAEEAARSVEEMQRELERLTATSRSDPTAAVERAAGATAENVRRMSSELTRSLRRDGLLDEVPARKSAPAAPDRKSVV